MLIFELATSLEKNHMSNRSKYLIIIFSLLAICVATFVIYNISRKPINPMFDYEKDIQSGDIHLISYGLQLAMPNEINAKRKADSIEKKLGFYWKNYGCIVDSESNILSTKYNEKVIEYLSKRNGIDWFKKYRKEIDSIYKNVK